MKNPQQIPDILLPYRQKKLRVGFSGGADSTALLIMLLEWGFAPEQLEAVHFDHGLRGLESCADAEWCREFCCRLGVDCQVVELNLLEKLPENGSLEDYARSARINWYRENFDQSPIVLAHHADDADENLLLKLSRGGNTSSLSSLRFERKLWNLTILRPLLAWRKVELEEFLLERNITDWRCDKSNESLDFHRNYLRNELLKKWALYHPAISGGLQKSREALAMDADFIEKCAEEKLSNLGESLPSTTSGDFWRNMHEALLGRVLRKYLSKLLACEALSLNWKAIARFKEALQLPPSPEERIVDLGENVLLTLKNDIFALKKVDYAASLTPQLWAWKSENLVDYGNWQLTSEVLPGAVTDRSAGIYCFDADLMPEALLLDFRRGGEQMSVWGSSELRHVKHILSGCKDKENMLILRDCVGGEIYLLGNFRRSNSAPVTAKTASTLKISVKKL